MYQTTLQLTMTPEQLGELFDERLSKALANYAPPPQPVDSPEFLTRKETAKLLRISQSTLHEWTKDHVIQSFEVNRCIRYRREDVRNLVKDVDAIKYKSKK